MELNRRQLLGAMAVLAAAGCAPAPSEAAPLPPGPVDGPGPLVDWIVAHRDSVSLLVDDGRGAVFTHLADRSRPIASAVKVAHLTAYAQAVVAGTIDPAGPVPVAEWERWYVPNTDGGAHPRALEALGATPESTVTWDDIATVMIDFSDNAAADLVRDAVGDPAMVAAAEAGGWSDLVVPSIAGEALTIGALDPAAERGAQTIAAARRWADGDRQVPDVGAVTWEQLVGHYDGAWSATVEQLASLHRAAATDGLGPEVSGIVRGHLERGLAEQAAAAGVLGSGQKGGSLPGILSNAFTLRRTDGTVGVSVISLSGMPEQVWSEALPSGASTLLSQQALLDAATLDRLRAAVAG